MTVNVYIAFKLNSQKSAKKLANKTAPNGAHVHVYIMRKSWMWTIHRLRCSKHRTALVRTIHGLLAQSIYHKKWRHRAWIRKIQWYWYTPHGRLFWVRSFMQARSHLIIYHCKIRPLFLRKENWENHIVWKMEGQLNWSRPSLHHD